MTEVLLEPQSAPQPDTGLTFYLRGALIIRTADDYAQVAEGLAVNKGFQARVKAWFAPLKTKAHDAHKAICQRENETLAPAIEDEAARKKALEAWDAEQRRIADDQRRKLEAEARRQQEELRQQEEQRRLAEAAALESAANRTGDEGLRAEAHSILAQPVEMPAITVTVEKATPKVAGLSYSDKWEVPLDQEGEPVGVSLRQLCAAIGSGAMPESYVKLNLSAVNKVFQATEGKAVITGVPCRHRRVPASRGR